MPMKRGRQLTAAERIAKATQQQPADQPLEEEPMHRDTEPPTDWSPERKIVGAAIATVILFVVQLAANIDVPIGVEGALAVIVGYLIPNKK